MKVTSFEVNKVTYIREKQAYLVRFTYFDENGSGTTDGCDVTIKLRVDQDMDKRVQSIHSEITKAINGYSMQRELQSLMKGKRIPLNGTKE